MKKMFLYPVWKFEIIEEQLAQMENHGWRLVKIHPFHRFEFKQCTPKYVQYFFSCNMAKEKLNMNIISSSLLQNGATRIDGNCGSLMTDIRFYRITNGTDLSQQRQLRNSFMSHFVLKQALIGLIVLLITLVPFIISTISGNSTNLSDNIFIVCWFTLWAVFTVYNFAGFLYLHRKNNK